MIIIQEKYRIAAAYFKEMKISHDKTLEHFCVGLQLGRCNCIGALGLKFI
jgi:hypothetical protein